MFAVPAGTVALPANPAAAHPVRLATELAADVTRWQTLLRFDPAARWSTLLERSEQHEAWLLSWLPGQGTTVHDHDGAAGAFTVVAGTLTDVSRGVRRELAVGQSRVFAPDAVHRVRNEGSVPAVSIHVYRPSRPATFLP